MRFTIIPESRSAGRLILRAEEMMAADAAAIEMGIAGVCLMENAGRHVARVVTQESPAAGRIILVCGAGNNGGDGFVAARHLQSWGYHPEIWLSCDEHAPQGDAGLNLRAARSSGVPIRSQASWGPEDLGATHVDVVVDALLGTGLRGPVRPETAALVRAVNTQESPVVAVDLPSGLCANRGTPLGCAVRATVTVTFQCSKPGHWLYPGAEHCGRLEIVDIGMPDEALPVDTGGGRVLMPDVLGAAFVERASRSHKGTYGHVGVVGGSLGRTGAVLMAADAALAAGAGLVTIGTEVRALHSVAREAYEVMVTPMIDVTQPQALAVDALQRYDALVIGPGYPDDPKCGERLINTLAELEQAMVIDADALNHAAGAPERFQSSGGRILTPHPGEAARLLGVTTQTVQEDRFAAVLELARRSGAVVVLKGAHTVIGTPAGHVAVCPYGNPGMATAGMGDVLAGVIGALLARGVDPVDAASSGVVWHAMAGDHALDGRGLNGLRARDVIRALAEVERCYRA